MESKLLFREFVFCAAPWQQRWRKKDHIFTKMSSSVNKKTTTCCVVKFTQPKILWVY